MDGLAHLVSTCKLTDAHAFLHASSCNPATYVRGTKRLDYILVSEGVLPFLRFGGIEAFFTTIHSDHRGLFIDIDLTALLGGELAKLLPSALRGISSNSPHGEKYINNILTYFEEHNIFARAQVVFAALDASTIPISPSLLVAVNRLDRDITRAMLHAENQCRQPERPPWSHALHLASKAVRFWKTIHLQLPQPRRRFRGTVPYRR